MLRLSLFSLFFILLCAAGCDTGASGEQGDLLEQARTLMSSGQYEQAMVFYGEALALASGYDPLLQLEYSEAAVLSAQADRNRASRQKALEALQVLTETPGTVEPREIGELWRRLGWEMARDADSLQAYNAFGAAIAVCPELTGVYEEEWLLRGAFAAWHLSTVSTVPDSLVGTPMEDSILAYHAETHLIELDRIPLVRTDLRTPRLEATARLMQYAPSRWSDELEVLTELDRLGSIEPGWRHRRMELLLRSARADIEQGQVAMARERLMEVWTSSFTGVRVDAAVLLGEMAQGSGDSQTALLWYTRACQVSPGLTSQAAITAAARRDSLRYFVTPLGVE
jgi:tetratricopeptide (TPR) repeat protein